MMSETYCYRLRLGYEMISVVSEETDYLHVATIL